MWAHSSRGTRVTVMQAADLREGNNVAFRRRFGAPRCRRIAVQRQMRPGSVIIIEVVREYAVQMTFVQHDQVIQTFSAYGADHAFAVWILPWRAWCNKDFLDAHAFNSLLEVVTVDAIAIADEKPWGRLVREGVDDLLGGPFGIRIRGNVEVNDLSPIVTEKDENVQDAEGDGWSRETPPNVMPL